MLNALKKTFLRPLRQEEASADHRRHPRRAVVLDAVIYAIDYFSDVIIHNVSADGFMGEADVELTIGEKLHLTLDDKAFQTGTVRWTEGRTFGVAFDTPLARTGAGDDDVDYGSMPEHKPRGRRSMLNIPARLNLGRPPEPATVQNVSQSGMLLETAANVGAGQHLLVKLGDRSPVAAVVKWRKDDHIGIETAEPVGILSLVYSSN
ncbi:hypothetical protein SCH01S_33_00330 [Sphingomonas changbaiensis NBRC 104936]|uniref:PilZ domain-containing protein n=1 Tax=Sphingomonas changbaiensis NBRC 104936 TaxID=1219043 RepID=A0A0E9MQ39_9SPHN|nr:PilZ domain-containing protein [Sphingomonas changbaiensis]GAO39546.1 hypothetical protein SCH01S_33_00330 [Sphingomonas changbaiensis NBRC 104936]